MNSTAQKIKVTAYLIGQVAAVVLSLFGLLVAIYSVSISNVPATRIPQGSLISIAGWGVCVLLEKRKLSLTSTQVKMGFTK